MSLMKEGPMPKVSQAQRTVTADGFGFGFVVSQDNNRPAASFVFETEDDARAAQQKMQEILAKCRSVTSYL
jgi:hypothetical protein